MDFIAVPHMPSLFMNDKNVKIDRKIQIIVTQKKSEMILKISANKMG